MKCGVRRLVVGVRAFFCNPKYRWSYYVRDPKKQHNFHSLPRKKGIPYVDAPPGNSDYKG